MSDDRDSLLQVTAPNGVVWTRQAEGRATGRQLLEALDDLRGMYSDSSRRWNWWEEGRREREHDRLWAILSEWDNGATAGSPEESDATAQVLLDDIDERVERERDRRADLVAKSYDQERETARLQMLRAESDSAFFAQVMAKPATSAQRDDAERRAADSRASAETLRSVLGDPEWVIDRHGYLPAERRTRNLDLHMEFWRHPQLRKWSTTDRRRFRVLLGMPMPTSGQMCSECQAPADWHDYDLSLRLFHPPPEPGSQAETMARLMPGWWERCPACTAYQIGHRWGGKFALPDFDGEQWISMLPPLLRNIFIPTARKPRAKAAPKPRPLAVIEPGPIDQVLAQLSAAQDAHPQAQVRPGPRGGWELWPA